MNTNILEQAIYGLLSQMPYYGCLIQSMKHVISREVPTAGVRFDENGTSIRLAINPDFFASLTESERIALLIHEASHVDRLHLIRIPQATANHRLGNVAADAAINCYIPGLPKGGIYPKGLRLKNYQTFEYYLERLTDNQNEAQKQDGNSGESDSSERTEASESDSSDSDINDSSSGQSASPSDDSPNKRYIGPDVQPLDVHDWDNSGLSIGEQAGVIQATMERAIEKMGLDAGELPSHVKESLRYLRELRVRAWHRDLKNFLGRTVNGFNIERTYSRRNRRYGLNEPGTRISGQKKLAVAFDTSGSMSSTELERCLAETMAMVKTGVVGYLIQFDSKVNDMQRLKSNMDFVQVYGRGGTSFKDLMERVDGLNCDGVVVFTDGADSGHCDKPRTPVLWVYTHGERVEKYDWGFKTVLD